MALPNGDLITTVFDPQMAYPVDKRMQVDTLNSRDSISMFIRWEGMTVYVLEDSKIYILQGGRSNEYWKELGTGTGTGGTTFVGQFPTADLLPTSGRSAGDYAFVGTGDDFVQYNWDNIANQWVMAEGQTDMASEFFHIGYKTPLRRPVIFPLFPKDVLVETSGDFVFAPETAVARFIFTGEVDAIRGIETAEADRENKYVNRTGSDIILRDKASGIPSGSGMDFGGTDYTWVNGSEITLKGNGTYWELAPNNQIAFSDHLDSVNAQVSVGSDGKKVIGVVTDNDSGELVQYKEYDDLPPAVDDFMIINHNGENYIRAFDTTESRVLSVSNVDELRDLSLTDLVRIRLGYYRKVETKGYYESGDGGGIEYNIKFGSVAIDDGFLIIRPTNNLGVEFNPNIKDHIPAKISGLKSEIGFDNRNALLKIFNNSNGRKILFPNKGVLEFSGVLSIQVHDSEIDFNNCEFKTITNSGGSKIIIEDSSESAFYNWIVNGNKSSITSDTVIGMEIKNSSNLYFDKITIKNCAYHGLYIRPATKNIKFGVIFFYENKGNNTSSHLYISNHEDDDVEFNFIYSSEDQFDGNSRQTAYIDAYNTTINNIISINSTYSADYRKGNHYLGYSLSKGGQSTVKVGGGSNEGRPILVANNVVGEDIKGFGGLTWGAFISNCEKVDIKSITLNISDEIIPPVMSGIYINNTSAAGVQRNITIENAYINNFTLSGVLLAEIDNPVRIKNLVCNGKTGADAAIRLENCDAPISIDGFQFSNVDRDVRVFSGTDTVVFNDPIFESKRRLIPKTIPTGIYQPTRAERWNYLIFDGTGPIGIVANRFRGGDVIEGEVSSGGSRSFSSGAGVTLRFPEGQGNIAPALSRFIINFKTDNDALVTVIKPYAYPNASTTERGIIEQATDAETITGTDTERAVSPANLQAKLNSLIISATATLDFPVISAGETERLTATVTGAALLDPVLVSGPANIYNSNDSTIDAWVSAANTVTVRVRNNGSSSIDPGSGDFKIKVFK